LGKSTKKNTNLHFPLLFVAIGTGLNEIRIRYKHPRSATLLYAMSNGHNITDFHGAQTNTTHKLAYVNKEKE
jgi:hypothetical protein